MRELQVLAMLCLAENAWKFPEEFFAVDGPMQIYELTMHYCTSDYSEHKAVVGHALILLNRLLVSSPRVCTLMEQQNAIQLLLFLFETCEDEGTRAQAIRAVALQCNMNRTNITDPINNNANNNLPGNSNNESNETSAGQPGMAPSNPLICQTQLRQQGGEYTMSSTHHLIAYHTPEHHTHYLRPYPHILSSPSLPMLTPYPHLHSPPPSPSPLGIPLLVQAMRDHVSAKRPLAGLRAGVKILDKYTLDPEDPILQPLNGKKKGSCECQVLLYVEGRFVEGRY